MRRNRVIHFDNESTSHAYRNGSGDYSILSYLEFTHREEVTITEMDANNTTTTSDIGTFFENDDKYETSAEDDQVKKILRWGIILASVALMLFCSVCMAAYILHRRRRTHHVAPHQWTSSRGQDDQGTVAEDDSIVEDNIKGTCAV